MKKWVPLTTIKIVLGALKKGGRLKSPHRNYILRNEMLGLIRAKNFHARPKTFIKLFNIYFFRFMKNYSDNLFCFHFQDFKFVHLLAERLVPLLGK